MGKFDRHIISNHINLKILWSIFELPKKDNVYSVLKAIVTKQGADAAVYCIAAMIPLISTLKGIETLIPAAICLAIIVSWNGLYFVRAYTKRIEAKARLDELRIEAGMDLLKKHAKHLSKEAKERLDLILTQSKSK